LNFVSNKMQIVDRKPSQMFQISTFDR
jgi:hypothetical protein